MIYRLWLEHYLLTFKRDKVKDSTLKYYEYRFKSLSPLYDIELSVLSIFDIQNLVNALHSAGLSYSTVKGTYSLLEQSLNKAVSCKLISFNPCIGVELPKKDKHEIDSLSEFEIRQLLVCNSRNFYYPVFLFLLHSGLRAGELIALEWDNIDFKSGVIHICSNYYRGELSTPKTEQGERDIPLTRSLLNLLPDRSDRRGGLVFRNSFSCRIDYHILLRSWYRQQESANFKNRYGLHALRHTFATNLIHNGADVKTVSLLLGHKDVQTTLNFYCHSSLEEKRKVISLLDYKVF